MMVASIVIIYLFVGYSSLVGLALLLISGFLNGKLAQK